jgi:carbon monoxide dehydrogenase subunit G
MLISEKFNIDISIKTLYEFLLDAQSVGACIPGCESIEAIGENEYDSIIKTKVGGISAKFKVRTVISETVPFNLIRTVGYGKEIRNLGQFKQKTEIGLKELSSNETEVSYQSDVSIVGRLATFGDRIMRSKAKTMGQEFADSVKSKFSPDQPADLDEHQSVEPSKSKESIWQQLTRAITD